MALMMKAESTSETSVSFYQITRLNNPEDSHLHNRRRDNLKSHFTALKFRYQLKTKDFIMLTVTLV
jgi:hypothetical protein